MSTGAETVLVTARSFSTGEVDQLARLRAAGVEVVRASPIHDLREMRDVLSRATAWIAGTRPVTVQHFLQAPRLRILARYGVGVDSVDLDAAAARGIVVTNTPGANSAAVADHAMALLLASLRHVVVGDANVRRGEWRPLRGQELAHQTVGIYGLGQIGTAVVRRLAGFGCDIIAVDPAEAATQVGQGLGVTLVGPDELAARATIVSLHAPGGAQPLIDSSWLGLAVHPVVIVNTARADLVDEQALSAGLESGRVRAYAADTLGSEGSGQGSPLLSPRFADRVIVTPHVGAHTAQAVDRMGSMAVDDVLRVLSGRPPRHPVVPRVDGTTL